MLKLRKRHRLRKKEIKELQAQLEAAYGSSTFLEDDPVDRAEIKVSPDAKRKDFDVLLLGNEAVALVLENGDIMLTVQGVLRFRPKLRYVEVDKGAIKFVTNGADVMAPGITDADRGIKEGHCVYIRDQDHKKPLAAGIALIDGETMVAGATGKAVRSVHYVGDNIWDLKD
jgi:PUA domain protein